MARDLTDDRAFFLSTLPAGSRDRWLASVTAGVSAAIFLAALPFAKVPLTPIGAFIPTYQSALVINDLITAGLLFGQFTILHARGLLVLAGGYLFAAFITIAHTLSFPGLFAPSGLLGAGPQTTAWLYMVWHAGFPMFVIAYALLDRDSVPTLMPKRPSVGLILGWIVAIFLIAAGITLVVTAGQAHLPAIMQDNRYTPAMIGVVSTVWALTFVALLALWRRRPRMVLDLWLMVVICAWAFDVALSAVFNSGRFDLGFYAGRTYGLLASSFVLLVLLIENNTLYARLAEAHEKRVRRIGILRGIDRAIAAEESPEAIAATVIQPLRELLGVPRAVVNIFDFQANEVEWLAAAGRRRTRAGPGVRYSLALMGDIDALRRGEPQVIDTHSLPPGPEVDALLKSGVHAYMAIPMIAGGELIGALSFGGELRQFPAEQVNIAREVATQLAIAISQARRADRNLLQANASAREARQASRTAQARLATGSLSLHGKLIHRSVRFHT